MVQGLQEQWVQDSAPKACADAASAALSFFCMDVLCISHLHSAQALRLFLLLRAVNVQHLLSRVLPVEACRKARRRECAGLLFSGSCMLAGNLAKRCMQRRSDLVLQEIGSVSGDASCLVAEPVAWFDGVLCSHCLRTSAGSVIRQSVRIHCSGCSIQTVAAAWAAC